MADTLSWWWVDSNEVFRIATTEQIRTAIEDGTLADNTLVFRTGMAAFVPASSVAFFSDVKAPAAGMAPPTTAPCAPPGEVTPASADVQTALDKTKRSGLPTGTLFGHAVAEPSTWTPPREKPRSLFPMSTSESSAPATKKSTSSPPAKLPSSPPAKLPSSPPAKLPSSPPAKLPSSPPKTISGFPVRKPEEQDSTAAPRTSAYPPRGMSSYQPVSPSGSTRPVPPRMASTRPLPPSGHTVTLPLPPQVPSFDATEGSSEAAEEQRIGSTRPVEEGAEPGNMRGFWERQDPSEIDGAMHADPIRQSTPEAARPSIPVLPISQPPKWILPAVGVVCGVSVIGLVSFILLSSRAKAPTQLSPMPSSSVQALSTASVAASAEPAVSASAAVVELPPPMAASTIPCKAELRPTRVVSKAWRGIPIETGALEDGSLVAAGFATDEYTAFGVVIERATLRLKKSSLDQRMVSPVRRVVPLVDGEQIDFAIDMVDKEAVQQDALTIPAAPPVKLGWFQDSLTVTSQASPVPAVLWKKPSEQGAEALRGLAVPSRGTSVTFRVGDRIYLGSMDEKYDPRGALHRIEGTGQKVGAPSIAWNGRELMVVFANLESETGGWKVRYARSGFGTAPRESEEWEMPEGGPGGEALAPSVLGQPDGRWLFVWTEGAKGKRDVRARTYDADMKPLGEAFSISSKGANAGQGVIAMRGTKGAVFYFTLVGTNYEVWATSVSCPRE